MHLTPSESLALHGIDCADCADTGRCAQYFDGCGWEQRPAREGEETFPCRSCEPAPLPCPYCGAAPHVSDDRDDGVMVHCRACFSGPGDLCVLANTRDEAVAEWNERVESC